MTEIPLAEATTAASGRIGSGDEQLGRRGGRRCAVVSGRSSTGARGRSSAVGVEVRWERSSVRRGGEGGAAGVVGRVAAAVCEGRRRVGGGKT